MERCIAHTFLFDTFVPHSTLFTQKLREYEKIVKISMKKIFNFLVKVDYAGFSRCLTSHLMSSFSIFECYLRPMLTFVYSLLNLVSILKFQN